MIPKATKSYAMEDPTPGEGPAAGGEALRIYIYIFLGSPGLPTHFKHFWALAAKWPSGSLWRLILCISGPWLPNGFQEASGGSF